MSDEPTRNRGGRPRVAEPGVALSTYVRASDYDRIARLALKQDRSVSAIVRDLLRLRLDRFSVD